MSSHSSAQTEQTLRHHLQSFYVGDVEAIMAVPWIAVCTDAEGRRLAIEQLVNDIVEGAQSQW